MYIIPGFYLLISHSLRYHLLPYLYKFYFKSVEVLQSATSVMQCGYCCNLSENLARYHAQQRVLFIETTVNQEQFCAFALFKVNTKSQAVSHSYSK